ncbi:MAG: hypothetical protein J6I50_11910 [Clostridia bacterium]|nr:hypothetical protein [Clostridia bacterium]
MKNRCYFAASLLAFLILAPSAISCADSHSQKTTETENHVTETALESETVNPNDRSQIKDTLPDTLNYNGRQFTIYCASTDYNEDYIAGPEEETGEIVDDAVYQRNISVAERLNVVIQSDSYDEGWNTIGPAVSKLIMAGDTTYDLFMGAQAGLTQLVTDNCFVNAYDLEHIDFNQPWWNNSYMNELAIGENYRFYLNGDYFISTLLWTRVVFFNKVMYANYYDDANALYQSVFDGKWTLDRMAELAKDVYIDVNNDSKSDGDDQLGYVAYLAASSTDGFVYGTDIPFTQRDENGYVILNMMSDDAVTLAQKLPAFYAQPGSFWKDISSDAQNQEVFMKGKTLFLGNSALCHAKDLRNMADDFGFLPFPKFDEEQKEYRSLIHDSAMIGVVSNASQNLDMTGAVLEALNAETYRSVTPVWYETALKVKYSRDDYSTQMIDLIHDSATTNFVYAYNYALNGIGLIYRDLCNRNSSDYASAVKKLEKTAARKLEKIIDIFNGSLDQ